MKENKERQEIALSESQNAEVRKVVSITEAAKINKVTRQAIYVAIKQKKLKATKKTRWEIDLKDLEEYRKNKYSRTKSMFDGALLFDNEKGFFSINQVAKMLGVPAQKIYYATRTGMIKGSRKGAAWVIHAEEVQRYKEEYLNRKSAKEAS
jgi:excisionase family DNA binding protein